MLKTFARLSSVIALSIPAICCNAPAPTPTTAPSSSSSPAPASSSAQGELKFAAPAGWVSEQSSSSMRVAQYKLPHADGDQDDAQLVLYYFGPGQGGSVEANLERWMGQMVQPDGKPSKDKATTDSLTVNGLKVSLLDVTGTYTAEMSPGADAHHNNSGYRMRAAVIETPKGPYFAKLVGPEKTVGKWENEFKSYLNSFSFK